jgi:hypothetical protein
MLWNFGSIVGKKLIWLVSQVIVRLERIGNETINNLTTKRVVCLSAI